MKFSYFCRQQDSYLDFLMMMTKEEVLAALATVQEPDLGRDLVSLNMIRDLELENEKVKFTVMLTTPACPLKEKIERDCVRAIQERLGASIQVEVHMSAEVGSGRLDAKEVLPGVKNIILVASGKGGVGKSTVSVNLALGLAQEGARVGILDADIYGPSLPIMMGIRNQRPKMQDVQGKGMIVPIERFGIKVMSIGLLIDEKQAVVWRGPMASSALKQFVKDVAWGELDYLIIDLPPGTGDVHLTLVQAVPVTGAVIVSTPQLVAAADAQKAIMMFNQAQIKVPILGVVENMAYFTPAELPENRYYLFGQGGSRKMAEQFELPFLGEVPLVQSIREGGDTGIPAVLDDQDQVRDAFIGLAQEVARRVSILHAGAHATVLAEE